jgi:NAD(P)-dependent dehydrogenase (short-subunit alcohol dehydrogenase family)
MAGLSASTPTLHGKVALVTGAGRGIGRATSIGLAEAGATVGLLARSVGELEEVEKVVTGLGGTALVCPADVGDRRQLAEVAAKLTSELGPVDILVNNAAVVWPLGPTTSVGPDAWATAMSVNLVGVFTLTSLVLPAMLERGWGRIVNVSSGIADHPEAMIGGNAYATSKAGLEAHTKNLAAELDGTGVTVNGYRPGGVDTAMQAWIRSRPADEIGTTLHERFQTSYENGSLITPEHSARSLITHLTGSDNGQIWSVDDA